MNPITSAKVMWSNVPGFVLRSNCSSVRFGWSCDWLLSSVPDVGHAVVQLKMMWIDATGIDATGIEPTGDVASAIEATGIEPIGIEPTGIEPTGIEPTGIEPMGEY